MKSCGVGGARRVADLLPGGVEPAVADVLLDRPREEQRLLEDDADLLPQRLELEVAEVDAVDHDAARSRIVEADEQAHQGALAGAGGADDGDPLAGARLEGDVVERVVAARVGEVDVPDGDAALARGRARPRRASP